MSETYRREVFGKLAMAEPLTRTMAVLLAVFAAVFALQIAVRPFREFVFNYPFQPAGGPGIKGLGASAVVYGLMVAIDGLEVMDNDPR